MTRAVWSIFAGLAAVVCGVQSDAADASSASLASPGPIVVAQAHIRPGDRAYRRPAPPAMLAQSVVPASPVVAMQATMVTPAVVAQGGVVRSVAPTPSQPGVLWVIAMGAVLCRVGARVLRVS